MQVRSKIAAICCSTLVACAPNATPGPPAIEVNEADHIVNNPAFEITPADKGLCLQDKQRYNQRIMQAEAAKQQHQRILSTYPGDAFLCIPAVEKGQRTVQLFRYRAEDILAAVPDYSEPVETLSVAPFAQQSCRDLVEAQFGHNRFGNHICEQARGYARSETAYVCVTPAPPDQSREQRRLFEQVKVLKGRIERDC